LPDLPVIAVGEHTARTARQKGFKILQTGTGGVRDLDLSAYKKILYPSALEPSFIPEKTLHWPVYQTLPNPYFKITDPDPIITIFSVKAAHIVMGHTDIQARILCLSNEIADTFDTRGYRNLAVSASPRYADMRNLILQEVEHV
jgi:uroporphyrinogen-III synthase